MILKRIKLRNFRNYDSVQINLTKGINIIYGKNAQGKTNLLESIYVLGITKSHRNINENNLIKENSDFFNIEGTLKKEDLIYNLKIYMDKNKKKCFLDNIEVKKISDYISNMNIIIFCPDDLEIIKSSPQIRRKYLDTQLSQLYQNYFIILNEYNKLLKMRNEYLKLIIKEKNKNTDYLYVLNNHLVDKAIMIYKMRYKYIEKINKMCDEIFYNIMKKQNFKIVYKPSVDIDIFDLDIKNKLLKLYEESYDIDIKNMSTTIGPHKDDFEFFIDNINLKYYGSQGQQRIAVLSLKLSEVEIFKKYKKTTPILLLDDIFSELDNLNKNNLIKYISKNIQTIITTTDLDNIDYKLIKKSKLFKIEAGKIIKIKEERL